MISLDQANTLIESELSKLELPTQPENLYEPVKYILSNGGKRLRPSLVLLSAGLFSETVHHAIGPAIGIEIFHNFTLLHDDLMDNSEIRRNRQTVHIKWSPDIAILSGDVMSIIAGKFMSDVDDKYLRKVLVTFYRASVEVCEGQMMDMEFENRLDVSEEEYLKMIELKTSVLIAASLKIGALASGAAESDANQLYEFGRNLGLAFQLQDDYLDSYGDPGVFGKKIGNDILTNKKTYLMISALNIAGDFDLLKLKGLLNSVDYEPEEKLNDVLKIFDNCKVKEKTLEKIDEFFKKSADSLKTLNIPFERKAELEKFAQSLSLRKR